MMARFKLLIIMALMLSFACNSGQGKAREAYDSGIEQMHHSMPGEALKHFDAAIALDPGFAEAYFQRANALFNLGRYDESLIDYDRSISIDSTNADCFYNRASLKSIQGKQDEACSDYRKALELGKSIASDKIRQCP